MTIPHLLRLLVSMQLGPLFRLAAPLAVLLLTQGCSTGEIKLYGHDLTDFPGGQVSFMTRSTSLTLLGDARLKAMGVPGETPDARYENFYSTERDNNMVKVAEDQEIAGLLEAFSKMGLKKEASPRGPEGLDVGAALAVVEGSTSYVLVRPKPTEASPELVKNFDDYAKFFVDLFNSIEGYQSLGNQSIDFRSRHDKAMTK